MQNIVTELWEYIQLAGFVGPPLVAATIVLWFSIGVRHASLVRGSRRSARVLIQRFRSGEQHAPKGIVDSAASVGIEIQEKHPRDLRRFLDDAFFDYYQSIKKYSTLITVIVAVAPLLGLLGTVAGMIETFESLGDMTLFSQSGGIAGGISQALLTTQMGLAVAIPGLLVKGFLDRRQKQIEMELAQIKDILCAEQKHHAQGAF